jgi:hypothetical protein
MRLNPPSTFLFLLVALTVWTVPARAEPITAVFDVTTSRRTSVVTGLTEIFEQSFTLFMTLDPAEPLPGSPYGPITFSPVPLPGPSAPSGLENFSTFQHSFHGPGLLGGEEEEGNIAVDLFARAIFGQSGFFPGGTGEFATGVQLVSYVENVSPLPTFTPGTFPAHLGLLGDNRFNFEYFAELRRPFAPFSPDSYGYLGRATFREVQAPVVPEPATVALVGGGLALLAATRQRRGKQIRGSQRVAMRLNPRCTFP